MKVIATKKFRWSGKTLQAGDIFDAGTHGNVLIILKMATPVEKRKYKRRDMIAQDDILNKAIEADIN